MQLSSKGLKVLVALLNNPTIPMCGADLYKQTGVGAGTIYPMLSRFQAAGWLDCEWEAVDPAKIGRPRKRLYTLTPSGIRGARNALSEVQIVGLGGFACAT